jgi:hypothetical protein
VRQAPLVLYPLKFCAYMIALWRPVALGLPPPRPATSAPALGSPLAKSAPGLGSPLPHLHRDWAHPCPHRRRDWGSACRRHSHESVGQAAVLCDRLDDAPRTPPATEPRRLASAVPAARALLRASCAYAYPHACVAVSGWVGACVGWVGGRMDGWEGQAGGWADGDGWEGQAGGWARGWMDGDGCCR